VKNQSAKGRSFSFLKNKHTHTDTQCAFYLMGPFGCVCREREKKESKRYLRIVDASVGLGMTFWPTAQQHHVLFSNPSWLHPRTVSVSGVLVTRTWKIRFFFFFLTSNLKLAHDFMDKETLQ